MTTSSFGPTALDSPGCDMSQDDQVTEEMLFDSEDPDSNRYEDALYRLGSDSFYHLSSRLYKALGLGPECLFATALFWL